MAKVKTIRNNFNGGELSPKLDWRVELEKYQSGCKTLQNMFPLVEGGATRMPGTKYISETKDSSKSSRLFSFTVSSTESYILEVGDKYIRFYNNDARIESGGAPVEVTTVFEEAELFALNVTQREITLQLFNSNYHPQDLVYTSSTSWAISDTPFTPPPTTEQGHEPNAKLTPSATSGQSISFTASAGVFLVGDIGRKIGYGASSAIIISHTSSTVVVCDILGDFPDTNPIPSGDWTIEGSPNAELTPTNIYGGSFIELDVTGTTEVLTDLCGVAADYWGLSTNPGAVGEYYLKAAAPGYSGTEPDAVYIDGELAEVGLLDSLGINQWAWGFNIAAGINTITVRLSDSSDPDSNSPPVTFVQRGDGTTTTCFRSDDVDKYLYINGGVAKITTVDSSTKVTARTLASLWGMDATTDWSLEDKIWTAANGYPSAAVDFEQRLAVGGYPGSTQSVYLSESGNYNSFARDPDSDSRAIEFKLVSGESEAIHWLKSDDKLIIGTLGGVWHIGASSSSEPLTQINVTTKKRCNVATKDIQALTVTNAALWIPLTGLSVNRLDYSFDTDTYDALGINRVSEHIMEGATKVLSGVVDHAFQMNPVPIAWFVRADGQLIGLTYEVQEDIYAWFRVVTDGLFESVAVKKGESGEDELWCIVNRTINGSTVRNVEKFMPQNLYGDIKESFFIHSGVTYDGGDSVSITGITNANPCVVTATNTFTDGDKIRIKDVSGMTEINIGITKAWTVANVTGTTFELSGIDSTGWGTYTSGGTAQVVKKEFTVSHLIGETCDILIDGAVHPQRTVDSSGLVTLGYYGNLVHIGLPAHSILEPTEPTFDTTSGNSKGNKQRINRAMVSFYETYGCKIGRDLDNLKSVKFGDGSSPSLFTGDKDVPFSGLWANNTSLVIKQELPLPMTVKAISYWLNVNEK